MLREWGACWKNKKQEGVPESAEKAGTGEGNWRLPGTQGAGLERRA